MCRVSANFFNDELKSSEAFSSGFGRSELLEPVEAVVPAPMIVNLDRLLELTGGSEIRLAHENELRVLFPGCELGAMPPLGPIYGQAVFVDVALAGEPEIVFDAGTHTEAIRMRLDKFCST